jgi:PAS domain S-box-containing protein
MEKANPAVKWFSRVAVVAGGLSATMGLLALIGWHTHIAILVQGRPSSAAMVYNTALGLFLSGMAVVSLALGRPRVALAGSFYGVVVGLLTIIEYLFRLNLGIDQLLMNAYIVTGNAHPGRMAINTALCFALIGIAILLSLKRSSLQRQPFIVGLLGSIVLALGTVALSGYFTGITSAYTWGNFTQIAIHTAATFMMLGAGLIALAWRDGLTADSRTLRWLPILTAVGIAVMTVCLWQALLVNQHAQIDQGARSQTESVKREIETCLEPQILALGRMAERQEQEAVWNKEKWELDALHYVRDARFSLVIYWIDAAFHVREVVPLIGNEKVIGLDLTFEEQRRSAIMAARDNHEIVITRSLDLGPGGSGIEVYAPVMRDGAVTGYIAGVFREQTLLDAILTADIAPGYVIAVVDGEEEIYRRTDAGRQPEAGSMQRADIVLRGIVWRVQVWPGTGKMKELRSLLPEISLALGLLMAAIFAYAIHLAQKARLRTKEAIATSQKLEREIVERKHAEDALHRYASEFRAYLYNQAPCGYHSLSADGTFIRINDTELAWLGYTREEIIGRKRFTDLITADSQQTYQANFSNFDNQSWVADLEFDMICKDGSIMNVLLNASAERDAQGNFLMSRSTVFDISERKRVQDELRQAHDALEQRVKERTNELEITNGILILEVDDRRQTEQQLRESQARQAAIIDSAMDAIITIDADQRILVFNSSAEMVFKCTAKEALGSSLERFVPLHLRRRLDEHLKTLKRTSTIRRERGSFGDLTGLRADGEEFPIEASISQIEANGQQLYTLILRDITERKQAEEALKQAHDELEMRVQHRTAQLLAANTELEAYIEDRRQMEMALQQAHDAALESARLKSEFVANMSHEIRTPMNGIIGLTEIALQSELSPQQQQYLKLVKVSADSLLTIINDILDFSKIEAGKLEFERIAFYLRETLGDVMKALGSRAQAKGLELICEVAADVPETLIGDPGRLRQVIINLVSNAIKFTERGAVSIRVEKRAQAGGQVQLHVVVADTGIGIPVEKQKVIFDSFVQADGSTARQYGGTGLGLSISSGLVEMMGSKLGVNSEVGKGSEFFFTAWFERSLAHPAPRETIVPVAAQNANRRLRILLAEDHEINQQLAVYLLEGLGHKVVVAKNGHVALAALEDGQFDVVLMDIEMPQMTGFEATAAIREKERATGAHIPIIAVTAYAMSGDRERCLAAGMDAYISKPIRAQELFQKLDRLALAATVTSDAQAQTNGHKKPSPETLLDHGAMLASVNGNADFLHKLISLFLRRYPESLSELRAALAASDSKELARAAHTLRGGSGSFLTASALSSLASLEEMGRAGNLDQAAGALSEFESEIPLIDRELTALLTESAV